MNRELIDITYDLAEARAKKANAEKVIKELTPRYMELLDQEYGSGQVEFTYDGYRYGRVMAEKPHFRLADFLDEQPQIAQRVVIETSSLMLDEQALDAYLAEHPEDQEKVSRYVDTTLEARWKKPVPVKDSDE